jgi:hypothetical protein
MKYLSFFVFFHLIIWAAQTVAVEAREDAVPGSRYTSARGAAMGDAFLPLADDASALFYNPADITKVRKTGLELMNLSIYGDPGYFSGMSATNFFKIPSLSSYQSVLASNPGQMAGVGASFLPAFFTRGFGFGLLTQTQLSATVNPGGAIHYRSLYQLIPTAGFGIRLAEGIVRLGYSIQFVNEALGDVTVPSGTSPLGYNRGLSQGSALSHQLGATLTMPWTYLPALSIVARNVGGTHYNSTSLIQFSPNPTGAPPTDPMSLDASLSCQNKLGYGSYFNFVGELRDFTDESGISILGRAAIGTEYSFRDQFFLRAGWGSGYPSAGIGLRQGKGELSLTWYSEELGQSYHSLRDQRYMVQYTVKAF